MQLLKIKRNAFYQNVLGVPERLRIKLRLQFFAGLHGTLTWQKVMAAYCLVYGVIHFTSPAG